MKALTPILAILLLASAAYAAPIVDPVADFKSGLTIPSGDKILKWDLDVNGDGKNEVLLSLKSDFDKNTQDHEPSSWDFYIADAGTGFQNGGGIETSPNILDHILPQIDTDACFVGQISELGQRGIVTMTQATRRSGVTMVTIYAYTVVGDHLKKSILAKYNPDQGDSPLFTKYLAEDKRTHVTLQEITP